MRTANRSSLSPDSHSSDVNADLPLLWPLVLLALPVLAEHALHTIVGMTDAFLANHVVSTEGLTGSSLASAHDLNAAAGAAVGSITYISWFIGLIVSSIGTGATAIIARAIGARHRRLANRVAGQAVLGAAVTGVVMAVALYLGSGTLVHLTGLEGQAAAFFLTYVRILSIGFPFAVLMFTANSCLRGAGDTVTPAVGMIVVDLVNLAVSSVLCWGLIGLPQLGVTGIAIGTAAAYVVGGVLQITVLFIGRGGIALYLHRLRPDPATLERILRIGLPSGSEGVLMWLGSFAVLRTVNDVSTSAAAAHNLAIRIESVSFMSGFAVATAVATTVGQNLGAGRPDRARRSAYLGYAIGGGMMVTLGLVFILFNQFCAGLFTDDPAVIAQTAGCLFLTGFIQVSFASAIIFGSALRGAGDTRAVMLLNLTSILLLRGIVAVAVGTYFKSLFAIWIVLCSELFIRGILMYGRFLSGKWTRVEV